MKLSVDPLSTIRAQLANAAEGTEDIVIGVVDGIPDLASPGLAGVALTIEPSMLPDDGSDEPDAHATDIASLILGRDTSSPGLAPGCAGLALPIFFGSSDSPRRASQLDLARALTLGSERSLAIINVSAGQRTSTPAVGRHLEDALVRCHERGILVVAAAGNDGCACIHVPAAVPIVLAVGAMDVDGRPHDISNWGDAYRASGLLAPGAELVIPGAENVRRTGTSYATAVVTAIAARILATARRSGLQLGALDVRRLLLETADPCDAARDGDCARHLAGRLNVTAALARLKQESPTATPRTNPIQEFRDLNYVSQERTMAQSHFQMTPESLPVSPPVVPQALQAQPTLAQQGCACGGSGKEHDEEHEAEAKRDGINQSTGDTLSNSVTQQGCACAGKQQPQLAYVLGSLWFDFGSEARYDAIVQQMKDPVAANTPPLLFDHLSEDLPLATGLTFILMQDQTPIYAVQPAGPFAREIYQVMLDALKSSIQPEGDKQRVAIPGYVAGVTRLMNGMTLPVLYPDLRGMVKWQSETLIQSAKAAAAADDVPDDVILNFLDRVYDEMRNLGLAPSERAINYAATNAYQAAETFANALGRRLELNDIRVAKSPICRPDSDCWDVLITMFDPENERRAGRVYRYTVDVSEVLPVTIGRMRNWAMPLLSLAR
jgi:cyanobactin maturation PatA/PatG family protease